MTLRLRMRYNDKSRTQKTPALYGASLLVRDATPSDLPPGCAWIEAASVETAAQRIQERIVLGQDVSAIWVPPNRGTYRQARHFFAASAGQVSEESWDHRLKDKTPYKLQKKITALNQTDEAYLLEDQFQSGRHYNHTQYVTAYKEVTKWAKVFAKALKAESVNPAIESDHKYFAHPLSYYFHADGNGGKTKYRGLRVMIGWQGDPAFLYDSRQFSLMQGITKKRGFYVFRPLQEDITAWKPPQGAVVVITQGDWKRPFIAVHSAKGSDHAVEKRFRVQSKIDIDVS